MKKRILSAVLAVMMLGMTGCGTKKTTVGDVDLSQDVSFPLEEQTELSYWTANYAATVANSYSELPLYQELEKRTNVKLDFEHPMQAQMAEQFNVMIASGEYPDIMEMVHFVYPGGLKKAHSENIIVDLTPYLEKYAPNLTKFFEAYPEIKEESMVDGKILAFPQVRGAYMLRTYQGLVLRADMLKKYGLEVPETIEEWYNVLTALKANGVETPLNTDFNSLLDIIFAPAWGVRNDYYLEDGVVKFGLYEDGYKDFLAEMLKWKEEGLIDPDIVSIKSGDKILDAKISTDRAGAWITGIGSGIGGKITAMRKENPEFDIVPAPYPVLNEGDVRHMLPCDPTVNLGAGVSVSTKCKNIPVAISLLDYAFSKEGYLLYNFGIEGESYEMVDGKPMYTDFITNNPDGKSMSDAGKLYSRSFSIGPFVQSAVYGEQFYGQPRQQEAVEIWSGAARKAGSFNVLGEPTDEENLIITPKVTEIKTYASEWLAKLFMGETTLDSFDEFRAGLEKLGVKEVIELKQKIHNRHIEQYPLLAKPSAIEVDEYYWRDGE